MTTCKDCSCDLHSVREVNKSQCSDCFLETTREFTHSLVDENARLLVSRDHYKDLAWTFFICMILMSLTYWGLAWRKKK